MQIGRLNIAREIRAKWQNGGRGEGVGVNVEDGEERMREDKAVDSGRDEGEDWWVSSKGDRNTIIRGNASSYFLQGFLLFNFHHGAMRGGGGYELRTLLFLYFFINPSVN